MFTKFIANLKNANQKWTAKKKNQSCKAFEKEYGWDQMAAGERLRLRLLPSPAPSRWDLSAKTLVVKAPLFILVKVALSKRVPPVGNSAVCPTGESTHYRHPAPEIGHFGLFAELIFAFWRETTCGRLAFSWGHLAPEVNFASWTWLSAKGLTKLHRPIK